MTVAIAVVSTGLVAGCDLFDCDNEVLGVFPSPDGRLSAVVFNRGCGATTGFNVQVSVVERGASPKGGGNALDMDHTPGYPALDPPMWSGGGHLVLTIPHGARVLERRSKVGRVEISFRRL